MSPPGHNPPVITLSDESTLRQKPPAKKPPSTEKLVKSKEGICAGGRVFCPSLWRRACPGGSVSECVGRVGQQSIVTASLWIYYVITELAVCADIASGDCGTSWSYLQSD